MTVAMHCLKKRKMENKLILCLVSHIIIQHPAATSIIFIALSIYENFQCNQF